MKPKIDVDNKIRRSIKIYPLFYGLSADLIFWIAIQTLFLTTVKHLSASEINSLTFVGTLIAVVIQLFSIKIIRKIGRINSIKLGTIMLFLSSILFTVGVSYKLLLLAQILYSCGFIFKQMDNVVLIKNLKHFQKQDDYIKYQSRGSTLYSLFTLIIALFSGVIFNINCYFPMIICIVVSFINILLSNFIYEAKEKEEETINMNNFKLSKSLVLIILLFGLFYGSISIGQENSKIFMQYNMEKFLSTDRISIYLSIFITMSRIVRLISDAMFIKIYNKLKNNIIYLIELGLINAFILLIIGNYIGNGMLGISIMAMGFFLFLAIRDPFDNFIRKIGFENCQEKNHDRIIVYLSLSRKIGEILFSGIISMILLKYNYIFVTLFMLTTSLLYLIIIFKISGILNRKNNMDNF